MNRILATVAAASIALAFAAPAAAQQTTVVKLGFSSPLTGPQASAGQDNRDAALLAINELNAKGITIGQQKVRFELVAQDDAADPRQGVSAAQALADAKIGFVLGPYNSGVTMPASRVYNDAGMVVATVASNPRITEQNFPRLFRVGASDNQLGTKMAVYAAKEMKLKTVAIIDDRSSYGQGVAEEFAAEAQKQGLKIVKKEFTNDKATDFSTILTSIRALRPDAIFFGGYSAQGGPMLRQMKALKVESKLLGGDGICSSETDRLSGGAAAGTVFCTQGGAMLERAEAGRSFTQKYKEAYKRDPLTYAAAFYDATLLLADAMQKAGSTDPARVADVLAKGSFKGVAGEYAFDEKRNLKSSAVTVFGFKDGQPVPLTSL